MLSAAALVMLGDLRAAVPETISVLMLWGVVVVAARPTGGKTWQVLLAALAVRAVMLLSEPSLSDDLYRYLWEGRALLEGGNPYLHPPAALLWPDDPMRSLVNHPEVSSIYPPAALWLFALLGSIAYTPLAIQAAMGLADALIAWGIADILRGRGRSLAGAWLYALHPLAVVESASSGHLEPAAILCLVLAIRAWDRGGSGVGWAGAGALLKLLPGVVMISLAKKHPRALLGVAAAAVLTTLPFLDAGPALLRGLTTYAEHWSFNAGLFGVLEALFGTAARPIGITLGAAVCVGAVLRCADPARVALWAGGAFVLLSPTVHPWYIAWAWVPALICGVRSWTLLATLAPLSYIVLASYDPTTHTWEESAWPAWVQHLPFLMALLWESLQHLTQPGPWAPGAAESTSRSPSRTAPAPSTPAQPSMPSPSGSSGA